MTAVFLSVLVGVDFSPPGWNTRSARVEQFICAAALVSLSLSKARMMSRSWITSAGTLSSTYILFDGFVSLLSWWKQRCEEFNTVCLLLNLFRLCGMSLRDCGSDTQVFEGVLAVITTAMCRATIPFVMTQGTSGPNLHSSALAALSLSKVQFSVVLCVTMHPGCGEPRTVFIPSKCPPCMWQSRLFLCPQCT